MSLLRNRKNKIVVVVCVVALIVVVFCFVPFFSGRACVAKAVVCLDSDFLMFSPELKLIVDTPTAEALETLLPTLDSSTSRRYKIVLSYVPVNGDFSRGLSVMAKSSVLDVTEISTLEQVGSYEWWSVDLVVHLEQVYATCGFDSFEVERADLCLHLDMCRDLKYSDVTYWFFVYDGFSLFDLVFGDVELVEAS